MTQEIAVIEPAEYGPAMSALRPLQRSFVTAYLDHPNYSQTAMALAAGYAEKSAAASASNLMRDEKVLAAINEEGSKRLRGAGALAVGALIDILRKPTHKDHTKAIAMALDRTGFHAMSEHKVTVDDKRPETKAELIAAIKRVAEEAGLDEASVKKLIGPDEAIEAEFEEIIRVEDL